MKTIKGKYNLSKNDPHYKKAKEKKEISPREWITKTYIVNRQTKYLINFRCADKVMKIVQLDYSIDTSKPKRKIYVIAPGNEKYEEFYGYYKIARRIKDEEKVYNVTLNKKTK